MFKRTLRAGLALGLALALCGGHLRGDEPANLDPLKQQIRAYVDSGEYASSVADVALRATKYLRKRIAQGAKHGKKLAVVFDIDETALTNLPELVANDYGYIPKQWDAWVLSAQAHAIIPVQTIYDTAIRGKVDVFFITSRPESTRASTERNLREVGYDTWTKVFYKPTSDVTLTALGFKTDVRRKLTADGYDIVVNIGDQYSDLNGGYAERIYKLPNPFYLVK